MPMTKFLQASQKFEIQAFKRPKNKENLRKDHIAFSGSPQKHPYDREKVILIADPYSTHTFFYEFRADDIACVEELPSIVNLDNETVTIVRIWVKKGSIGIRCTPFWVEDTYPLS